MTELFMKIQTKSKQGSFIINLTNPLNCINNKTKLDTQRAVGMFTKVAIGPNLLYNNQYERK